MERRIAAGAIAAGALGLVAVIASQGLADPRPILHEDFRSSARSSGEVVGDGTAGKNPVAIAAGDKLLPEPGAGPSDGQPIFGKGGLGTDRQTEHKPNDQTSMDGTLHYSEVFNPSIVPFKRMTSLDAVRDDYTLYTASSALTDLEVGGQPRAGYDRFWAELQIELAPGRDVAIPSVAADMRLLSYETTPRTTLSFARDSADNYYVRSDESQASGVYRLVFLAEADPRYVVPEVPRNLRVRDLDPGRITPLPRRVQVVAERAHRKLGIDRDTRLGVALDALVRYHRAFAAGEPPTDTGDLFWDLFSNQRGVCRHRAFTFMVAANALGIPSRFLANEAHAWVEVHLPNQGWARIDLGGAALELDVENGDQKTMYQPRGTDPFPRPPEYDAGYTELTGDVSGLSPAQKAEARTVRPRGDGPGSAGGAGASSAGANGAGDGGNSASRAGDPTRPGDPSSPVGPGAGLPTVDPAAVADKQPTRIRVTSASRSGFRGEAIDVNGRVEGAGRGLAGLKIDLYLAPAGRAGEDARYVGHTASDASGRFTVTVTIPRDLELVDHEVFAATPGDATFQPSTSE